MWRVLEWRLPSAFTFLLEFVGYRRQDRRRGQRGPVQHGVPELVDVGQNLGDRDEQLLGDFLVQVGGKEQRARQRRRGEYGHLVFGGEFADARGDQVLALRDDDGGLALLAVVA